MRSTVNKFDDGIRREEALREYYFLEDLIDRYDEKSLKIKSWSITSSAIAIGVAFIENKPVLFALAFSGSIVFWYLDGLWNTYKGFYAARAKTLEEMLEGSNIHYPGPGIVRAFTERLQVKRHIKGIPDQMFSRNVWLPHFVIMFFGACFCAYSLWLRS